MPHAHLQKLLRATKTFPGHALAIFGLRNLRSTL